MGELLMSETIFLWSVCHPVILFIITELMFVKLCYWIEMVNLTTRKVQFSGSVVSESLRPHGLQHARLPCSSPSPGACSNLCALSSWCHPTISSSVIPFSSSLQSFPASGSFLVSQFFASSDQTIGALISASVCPMNSQYWFPLGMPGLISLQFKGLSLICI